jgi:voltage-gated potassium channel
MLTLSTLGVEAGPPPGPGGKVFTVSLILFGVVALFTAIGVGTEVVASGDLRRWLRMNQVTRSIGHLSGISWGRPGTRTWGFLWGAPDPDRQPSSD